MKKLNRECRVIAVDYDGTLAKDSNFPELGDVDPLAVATLAEFQQRGGEVILWTCRKGKDLLRVVAHCHDAGLDFDAVNENAPNHMRRWHEAHPEDIGMPQSPKIYADIYLDDHARFDGQVDWKRLNFELNGNYPF